MSEINVGTVSDFFAHPMVAGVDLVQVLKVGDRMHFLGHTTDFEMDLASMQIEHNNVTQARAGESVGIKVPERVRRGDNVYVVEV